MEPSVGVGRMSVASGRLPLVKPAARPRTFHVWPALCFAAVVVMPINGILRGTPSFAWSLLVAGTMLVGVLTLVARRPYLGGVSLVAGLLALIGVVAIWDTGDTFTHWRVGLQIAIYMAFMPWVARGIFQRSPAALSAAVTGLLVGQSLSAAVAIMQVLGASPAGFGLINGRAQGLAGNPNNLGLVAGVTLVVCVYLLLRRAPGPRTLVLGAAALNVAALIACGSISALIATLAGVVVLLMALRVRLRVPVLLAAAGGGVLWLLSATGGQFATPLDRVRQVTGQTDRVATWMERTDTYEGAWTRIVASPFAGRGLDDASGYLPGEILVHNVLLRAWFQGGMTVGIAFLLVYAALVVIILRAVWRGQDAISAGMLTVVIAFSLTSAALHQEYFWMLLSGAWALASTATSAPPKISQPV